MNTVETSTEFETHRVTQFETADILSISNFKLYTEVFSSIFSEDSMILQVGRYIIALNANLEMLRCNYSLTSHFDVTVGILVIV